MDGGRRVVVERLGPQLPDRGEVVVAGHGDAVVLPDEVDTRPRVGAVADEITE